jgi:hypothetical protein
MNNPYNRRITMVTARCSQTLATVLALAWCVCLLESSTAAREKGTVDVDKENGTLRVSIDGKPFFTYRYDTSNPELPRPVIHPLHGPTGEVITQTGDDSILDWPLSPTFPSGDSAILFNQDCPQPLNPWSNSTRNSGRE